MAMKRLHKLMKSMKLLLSCAKLESVLIVGVSLLMGIYSSLGIVIWKYIVDIIARALAEHSVKNVILLFVIYFLYHVVQFILYQIKSYVVWRYTAKVSLNLNQKIMEKSVKLPFSVYDQSEIYDILNKVNNESTNSISSFLNKIMAMIECGMALVSVLVIIAPLNIWIVVIALAATVPMAIIDMKMSNQLYTLNIELTESKRYAEKFKNMLTNHQYVIEIRTYRIAHYIKEKALFLQKENYSQENRLRLRQMRAGLLIDIFFTMIQFGIKIATVCYAIFKAFSIGTITMYINALDSMSMNLQMLVYNIASLNEDMLYISVMVDYFEMEELKEGSILLEAPIREIRFEHVSFKYPGNEKYTIKDISISFKMGKKYLLYGLNGAGKSTMIKLLLGLYPPTSGRIIINEIDLRELEKTSYYCRLGVIFQEYNKYPMNVKENIGLEHWQNFQAVKAAAAFSGADGFVKNLIHQYDTLLDKELTNGTQLSLGQWQKVALSRMMFQPHEVFILDEPTASLDITATNRLYHYMFMESEAMVIMISHESVVASKADIIIVIGRGTVLETGCYEELITKQGYFYHYIVEGKEENEKN